MKSENYWKRDGRRNHFPNGQCSQPDSAWSDGLQWYESQWGPKSDTGWYNRPEIDLKGKI